MNEQQIAKLIQDRADLLAALEEIVAGADIRMIVPRVFSIGSLDRFERAFVNARAAIAKATA